MDDHKPLDPRELVVSSETRAIRMDICKTCDNLNKISFCRLCKCFMPAKTWLAISTCPINKWH